MSWGPFRKEQSLFYQKHMTLHMIPAFDRGFLRGLTNVFLIRHPMRVVASYSKKRESPTLTDIGFVQQAELFDQVAQMLGHAPLVIDSAAIRQSPEAALTALCQRLGIDFTPKMLRWAAGPKPYDGVWAPHWYNAVHASTGFDEPEGPCRTCRRNTGPWWIRRFRFTISCSNIAKPYRKEFQMSEISEQAILETLPEMAAQRRKGRMIAGAFMAGAVVAGFALMQAFDSWIGAAIPLIVGLVAVLFVAAQVGRKQEVTLLPVIANGFGLQHQKGDRSFISMLPQGFVPEGDSQKVDDVLTGSVAGAAFTFAECRWATRALRVAISFRRSAFRRMKPSASFWS
jgi:hypothetical protein